MLGLLMPSRTSASLAVLLAASAACGGAPAAPPPPAEPATDAPNESAPAVPDPIIVIGAGIAGLSAAAEAAGTGARVLIIDRSSVFGGHAVVSGGGVTMINTPVQQAARLTDTPAMAAEDFLRWGEDASEDWVRRYAEQSRVQVYDWLTAMGVEFTGLAQLPGSRVARYHRTREGGLGLITPLYRNAVRLGAQLRFNEDVTELLVEDGRVIGVRTRGVRDGRDRVRDASAVILASGGFQSNLERVRLNWPRGLPIPERILAGSGRNSRGDGLDLARQAGAAMHRLDHQWNYATGLPDPRYPGGERGLNAEVPQSIWVNRLGRRFIDETAGTRVTYPAVLRQPGTFFWAILDADGARAMTIAGPEWADRAKVEREVLDNAVLAVKSDDLRGLARDAGLPFNRIRRAVAVHNAGNVGFRIERPPFYAIRMYPLARKSMGGVAVDENAQVVDKDGDPIPGLYAAGEVTGFAGINGRAALEGTFLGPSVLMGRVAGRAAAAQVPPVRPPRAISNVRVTPPAARFADDACTRCHPIQALALERTTWQHLAAAHRRVRTEGTPCASCHTEMYPYRVEQHRSDRLLQSQTCRHCHLPR
jgi:uncharacterized protein